MLDVFAPLGGGTPWKEPPVVATTTRNAGLPDLVELLRQQQSAKVDVVAPATTLRAQDDGLISVRGAEAVLSEDGVTDVDGLYRPTVVFHEGVADKLGIPVKYVRRMHDERPDLWAANVNGWLHGDTTGHLPGDQLFAPDERSFLFRGFTGGGSGPGVARALLSDRYAIIDNFDVLMAALEGIRKAGVSVDIPICDITERSMRVKVLAPGVTHHAHRLMREYRSPFRVPEIGQQRADLGFPAAYDFGYGPVSDPVVFAGLELRNSEVGDGAFTIAPHIVFRACTNGMTVSRDAVRAVHLGGKLDEGLVRWSADTVSKQLALITAKTADAVTTFLDSDYVGDVIRGIEVKAGIAVADPQATVRRVGKALQFDEATQAGILAHFMLGGQPTAGGVMQAVTSFAQVVPDADKARDLEAKALQALDLAAA